MQRTVECFYPGKSFPAISVTGASCSLHCRHCAGKYLSGMIPATSPDSLLAISEALAERGANGFLLSGGNDTSGKVPLSDFIEAIGEIKATTDLSINAHIGLASTQEISRLVGSGVDSFSVDIYGSDETVRDVLGLGVKADEYFRVVSDLMEAGAQSVAPHICVGIHAGQLKGEISALERLAQLQPDKLVLISLIPTRGTAYESVTPPGDDVMASVVRRAGELLPDAKLLLGCMRTKLSRRGEVSLIEAGIDGIVLPASSTVEGLAEKAYHVKKRSVCCCMP